MDAFSVSADVDISAAALIGVACGRGAKDAACALGPWALREDGLAARLGDRGIAAAWDEILEIAPGDLGVSALDAVAGIGGRLAASVQRQVVAGAPFAVIGGDHSCAVGTWTGAYHGVKRRGGLGLIWIDAHMDSHTPETTPSGTLHGMPLACLLGHGPLALTGLAVPGPALAPNRVCLVGVRSHEREEAALLARLGVRVFDMDEVARLGLNAVLADACAIARDGTAGFGVTIDLDAVDPADAPGVGSPVPGGLSGAALADGLRRLPRAAGFLGVEIAEYNPVRDRGGKTAALVRDLLAAILGGGVRR